MLAASLVIASTYTFPTFIEEIIDPFNYNAEDASLFGLLYNLLGVIGGLVFAGVLYYNSFMFKHASLLFTAATLALYVCLGLGLTSDWPYGVICLIITANGFFAVSSFSVVYEWAVRLTPLVSEAISGGMISAIANMVGFTEIMLIDYLSDPND